MHLYCIQTQVIFGSGIFETSQRTSRVKQKRRKTQHRDEEEEKEVFFSAVTQPKKRIDSHKSFKDKAQNLAKNLLELNFMNLLKDVAFWS